MSPTGSPPYRYNPLTRNDTIRVLTLLATTNQLECTIQEVRIQDGGYQALSYVWGSRDTPSSILVRDKAGTTLGYIPLTGNLESAMKNLRDSAEIKSKVFWIDQICIDQKSGKQNSDGGEKNSQVGMMGDIYTHASRVITYLGPAGPDAQEEENGIQLLNSLHAHFARNYQGFYDIGSIHDIMLEKNSLPTRQLPQNLRSQYNADFWGWKWLAKLAYSEWSQRLWIVQEQLLNNDTVMLRGQHLVDWDAVAIINILFYIGFLPEHWPRRVYVENYTSSGSPQDWNATVNPGDVAGSLYDLWWERENVRRRRIVPSLGNSAVTVLTGSLFTNMKRFEALRCKDPRDRIFALLAISNDIDQLDIVPDYTRDTSDIFISSSVSILWQSTDLSHLTTICRWSNDSGNGRKHPSWAINFPRPFNQESRNMDFIYDGSVMTHPKSQTKLRFETGDRVLVLRGSLVGSIALTTPPCYGAISWVLDLEDVEAMQVGLRFLLNWTELLLRNAKTVTINDVLQHYSSIVIRPNQIPLDEDGNIDEQEVLLQVWCFFRVTRNYIRTWPGFSSLGPKAEENLEHSKAVILQLAQFLLSEDDFSTFDPDAEVTDDEHAAFRRIRGAIGWRGRSMGVTQCGKFFSALNRTQPGDLFAALEGSTDRLWTLRPEPDGEHYRLIGDICVPGFMQGEIYKGKNPEDVDREFRIV